MRHGFSRRAVGAAVGVVVVLALGGCRSETHESETHEEAKRLPPKVTVQAPESYPVVALDGPVPDDHYKTLDLRLDPSVEQGSAEVIVDTTDAKDLADFRFPEDCSVSGAVATCLVSLAFYESSDLAPTDFLFKLRPKEGIAPGSSAVIKYTVTAGNATISPASHLQTRLNVIAEGALVHAPMPATVTLSQGGTYTLPVQVRNIGTRTKGGTPVKSGGTLAKGRSGVALSIELKTTYGGAGLELLGGNYTNCRYSLESKASSGPPGYSAAYCEFDTPLEPGKAYGLSTPLKVRAVAEHAKAEVSVGLSEISYSQERSGYKERRGTAGVLRLVPHPATGSTRSLLDMQYGTGQITKVDIKAPSVTGEPDVAAVGATIRADVGKPFDVKVGIRNVSTAPTYEGRVEYLSLQIPKGVDVQLADKRCQRKITTKSVLYWCKNDGRVLRPGDSVFFDFRMQVARPLAETNGFVHRYGSDEGNVNDESQLTISTHNR